MKHFTVLALCACTAGAFAQYSFDDGIADGSIGLTNGGTVTWANQFTAVAGSERITEILMSWDRNSSGGNMVPNGTAVTLNLWSDPNNDGSPADALILSTLASTVSNSDLPGFVVYDIPDVTLTAGQNFFVGAVITHNVGDFPASWDSTAPDGKSWITIGGTLGTAGSTFTTNDVGLNGDWLIRATGAPVPEPATIAVLGIGALAAMRKRRQK